MSHLYRSEFAPWKTNFKSIHVTNLSQNADHHDKAGCIRPVQCKTYYVDRRDGYFLHHRMGWKVKDMCRDPNKDRNCVKYDPIALKYKTRLENSMKNALAQIFP